MAPIITWHCREQFYPPGSNCILTTKTKKAAVKGGGRRAFLPFPQFDNDWVFYTHSIACACMTPNHQSLICYSGRNPSGHLIAWLALAATMPHQIAQCNVSPVSLPIIDMISNYWWLLALFHECVLVCPEVLVWCDRINWLPLTTGRYQNTDCS